MNANAKTGGGAQSKARKRDLERSRKYAREWNIAHPDRVKVSAKRWRSRNAEFLRKYGKQWRAQNPEYGAQQSRKWAKANPERARLLQLHYNYGLTPPRFYALLGEQNGLCALCGMVNDNGKSLAVDHKHADGYERLPKDERAKLVRGLLCVPCNLLLGFCRDETETLKMKLKRMWENVDAYLSRTGGAS